MAPFYVDESVGSDENGTGSIETPYRSIAYLLFKHADVTQANQVLVRKDATAVYEEPTQSSFKKAKKGAEGLEKKRKKAEELAEKEANEKGKERERREKLLEESKSIVLEEDSALPKSTRVRSSMNKRFRCSQLDTRPELSNSKD
jgi:asparaginyl-tRNA synthetase